MDSLLKSESGFSAPSQSTNNVIPTNLSSVPSKRRPRHRLSCAECRRLKLKCDRTWPCSSCTKRGCAHICPEGTLQSKVRTKDTSVLLARISELENLLQEKEHESRLHRRNDRLDENQVAARTAPDHPYTPIAPPSGQSQDPHVLALIDGIGTLNVSNDGRSRFLGLSASSAFFDGDWSDCHSIYTTTETSEDPNESSKFALPFTFETLLSNPTVDSKHLKSYLPDRHEAERLGNAYHDFVSHLCESLSRTDFNALLAEVYNDNCNEICVGKLALLYSLFSLSVLFNPAVQALHSDASKWHNAAEICLKSTDYLSSPSLATVQTIHTMGIYMLNSHVDGAEIYWPVLGTAMRLCQSMGLHRDGSNWGLESSELESRRRAFHEILFLDRLQSLVLGRPYAISDKHFDTLIPCSALVKSEHHHHESNVDFHVAKWRFSSCIGRVVDDAFSISSPSLADVNRLDEELRQFDRGLPTHLKCTSTLPISEGPRWSDQDPVNNKPAINGPIELQATMQQHFMSALENTTLLFLHRRAFALALSEAAHEPVNSSFSKSVIAVIIESSRNLVLISQAAQALYPELANRWWFIFCHAYNGATCVATLLIKSPRCMLVKHAWSTLSTAVAIFGTAADSGPLCRDLFNRLTRLHNNAVAVLSASTSAELLPNCKRLSVNQTPLNLPFSLNMLGERPFGLSHYLESSQSNMHPSVNDFPCELGASTRLTRKDRTKSMSNSSVASGRGPSQTSSRGSRASVGSASQNDLAMARAIGVATSLSQGSASTNNHSPILNDGINGTLTAPFDRSSWAGLINSPRDDFDDDDSVNPPCWENLSVEPGDEPFNSPIFSAPHSQPNHYFEGFTEHFHPPMVLPSNDVMLSPAVSNYNNIYGPLPNPALFENCGSHPSIGSNLNQTEDTTTSNEVITSPTSTQFDLLDTFLTW